MISDEFDFGRYISLNMRIMVENSNLYILKDKRDAQPFYSMEHVAVYIHEFILHFQNMFTALVDQHELLAIGHHWSLNSNFPLMITRLLRTARSAHLLCLVNFALNQFHQIPLDTEGSGGWINATEMGGLQWASYQIRKIAGCACAGNAGNVFPRRRFQKKPLVNDPDMHHGTCVTHVPWCMSGSLTCGDGENVPGACAPAILRIWQEAHCFLIALPL